MVSHRNDFMYTNQGLKLVVTMVWYTGHHFNLYQFVSVGAIIFHALYPGDLAEYSNCT